MKTISVFDKNFSITDSARYSISIQVSLDGFSFLVQNLETTKYVGLKQISFDNVFHPDDISKELKKTLDAEPLAHATYQSAKCVFLTPKVTIIPTPLFERNKLKSYFEFNIQLLGSEALYHRQLSSIGSYIVYAIPSDIATITGQYLPNINFYCQSQPNIQSALQLQESSKTADQLYMHIGKNFFDIVLAKNGRLLFHNCFNYSNPADFVYFTMNIFEQFKLNPESASLHIAGNISKMDEKYFWLKKYIRNVQLADQYSEEVFTHAFSDKELHRFSALINLRLCE